MTKQCMSCVNNAHSEPVPPTECFERKELLCTRKARRSLFRSHAALHPQHNNNTDTLDGDAHADGLHGIIASDVECVIDHQTTEDSAQALESSLRNTDGNHGAVYLEITASPIDIRLLTETYASCSACGAIATFLGVTRDHFQGKRVSKLSYEAYTRMALKQMRKIAFAIYEQFPQVHRVVISHRIGVVPVKESSVFIAVATEHRQSGLQAVGYAIDTLKATVPIWKREYYHDEAGCGTASGEVDTNSAVWKRNPEALQPR